jgi:aspartate aminotransferase
LTTRRLSRRAGLVLPSPTLLAARRAGELRETGRSVIDFTIGEPDFVTPQNISQAGILAIKQHKTKYTLPQGMTDLRIAVAEKFRRENGLEYSSDQIVISSGLKPIIFAVILATIDQGDEVLIPAPYWPTYVDLVALAGGVPILVNCTSSDGFRLRPDALEKSITTKSRMLILNSPTNPTGAVYTKEDLSELASVLRRTPQVLVLSDEMYEHLYYDSKPCSMAAVGRDMFDRTITANGLSKAYAMTGWRIGFAGGPTDVISSATAMLSQSQGSPCTISQYAALEALNGNQSSMTERKKVYQEKRDVVVRGLNATRGMSCMAPLGTFYAFASCEGVIGKRTPDARHISNDSDFAAALLETEGVAVIPGSVFGCADFVRLSFAVEIAQLEDGLSRIRRFCDLLV